MALVINAKHIIIFDDSCPFCRHQIRAIFLRDRAGVFAFAPREGKTAPAIYRGTPPAGSLILIERYATLDEQRLRFGKGALRIFWYLPGGWRLIGLLSFLPRFLTNPPYRLLSKNRHHLAKRVVDRPLPESECFLP